MSGQQRFDALYADAAKTRTKLKHAREANATKGCTFTPDTTKPKSRGSSGKKKSDKDTTPSSAARRFERLYEDSKSKAEKLDENEAKKIQQEMRYLY